MSSLSGDARLHVKKVRLPHRLSLLAASLTSMRDTIARLSPKSSVSGVAQAFDSLDAPRHLFEQVVDFHEEIELGPSPHFGESVPE